MNGNAVCLLLDPDVQHFTNAGQYLSARAESDILPTVLFPCGMEGREMCPASELPVTWQPGVSLSIRYPLGKGFVISPSVRRLLMVSTTANPVRLLPVAGTILAGGGEVALFSSNLPAKISPEIEVLSRDGLADACVWADCIIGDSFINDLPEWKSLVTRGERVDSGKKSFPRNPKRDIQVMVDTPMACLGTAGCGVCAIKTRHGWKNTCTDGPVFQLAELDI